MNTTEKEMFKWFTRFRVLRDEPLSRHSNIRIGGPADYLAVMDDMIKYEFLFKLCLEHHIPFLALGSGTNVLFADAGFRGMVAIVNFSGIRPFTDNTAWVQAGTPLAELKRYCLVNSYAGYEFTAGIPGTVGGAIYGNAGAYGRSISECVVHGSVLAPDGMSLLVNKKFFNFAYRDSELKRNNCILLSVELLFEKGDYSTILSKMREIHAIRTSKLPHWSVPTAGSYFKNIKDEQGNATAAAKYLDAVGSKQTSVGDAAVHPKHANIIYNRGNARAADVLELEAILKTRVFEQFGIELQREVMYIE